MDLGGADVLRVEPVVEADRWVIRRMTSAGAVVKRPPHIVLAPFWDIVQAFSQGELSCWIGSGAPGPISGLLPGVDRDLLQAVAAQAVLVEKLGASPVLDEVVHRRLDAVAQLDLRFQHRKTGDLLGQRLS